MEKYLGGSVMVIFTSCVLAVAVIFFIKLLGKQKVELDIKLENIEAIRIQLEKASELDEDECKLHDGAVNFCKTIEKNIVNQYNDLTKQPRYYVTAKIFGYPTKFSAEH